MLNRGVRDQIVERQASIGHMRKIEYFLTSRRKPPLSDRTTATTARYPANQKGPSTFWMPSGWGADDAPKRKMIQNASRSSARNPTPCGHDCALRSPLIVVCVAVTMVHMCTWRAQRAIRRISTLVQAGP